MARYLIQCDCGKQLPVEVGQAGGQVTCSCGAILDVPQLRKLRHMPVAEDKKEQAASRWSARHGLVAMSLLVIFVLVIANIWSMWTEPAVPRFEPDAYIHNVNDRLKTITPAEAWNLLLNYRLLAEHGFPLIDVANRPEIERQIEHRHFLRRWSWIAAAIFATIAATAAFWPAQQKTRRRGDKETRRTP
jgi:hypothetical protein